MELKTQAQLAEDIFRKTLLHFDRISEEDSTEFEQPTEQSMFLIKRMKGFADNFVYNSGEERDVNAYYSFFKDGSWMIFDETGKTQLGDCLKNEKVAAEDLPISYKVKFNGKGEWKISSKT